MIGRCIAFALCLAAALPAAAQETRRLQAMDRRGEILGWEAVGRIDTPRGTCTGALIADDLVLTAAHCVDGLSARHGIRFRAGYRHGESMADRRVARVAVSEGYPGSASGTLRAEAIPHDVALLALDAPVSSSEADPFRVHPDPVEGDTVSVVSYGRGRMEVLSRQAECRVTGRYRGGILGFDCNVTFGSSGAPVFARVDGRLRIVSLISGGGDGMAYGMTLPDEVAALKRALRRDAARAKPGTGARRITVGNGGDRPSGAKFVRPGGS